MEVPKASFRAGPREVGVPDRDDYIREFEKAAADFVSAQIAFTNAVIKAGKAGVSDDELAVIAGMSETEISQIPSGRWVTSARRRVDARASEGRQGVSRHRGSRRDRRPRART